MFNQTCVGSRIEQHSKYVNLVLIERKVFIHKAITKKTAFTQTSLLHYDKLEGKTTVSTETAIASASCTLVHKFVSTRLDEFFAHENHAWPPALSLHGKRRLTSAKHELLHCNEPHFQQEAPSYFVFEGAAMVHPCHSTTQKRSVNTVTLSSFPGLKDNYRAVLGLTSYGTSTDLTARKPQPEKNKGKAHAEKCCQCTLRVSYKMPQTMKNCSIF